jgi:hypothetical protein
VPYRPRLQSRRDTGPFGRRGRHRSRARQKDILAGALSVQVHHETLRAGNVTAIVVEVDRPHIVAAVTVGKVLVQPGQLGLERAILLGLVGAVRMQLVHRTQG